MNYLNYNQEGGFRLSTNILAAAQTAYTLFNQLGWLGGDLTIITGCVLTGSTVSDGYVFVSGEVLPFKGGNIGTNVIIRETITNYPFQNGTIKPVLHERYVTFGTSLPEETYLWADFKRIFQTKDIQAFKDDFEERITALENRPSDVPQGTVVRYNHPLVVLPPEGWEDWNPIDEQGRVWAARSVSDGDFGFGTKAGEKTHQLTVDELAAHAHEVWGQDNSALPNNSNSNEVANVEDSGSPGAKFRRLTSSKGGNQPHNNLQPYVAVRYIIKL